MDKKGDEGVGVYVDVNSNINIFAKLSTAGKLWDDDDFTGCKMDVYCSEIIESLETQVDNDVDEVRIFRTSLCSKNNITLWANLILLPFLYPGTK